MICVVNILTLRLYLNVLFCLWNIIVRFSKVESNGNIFRLFNKYIFRLPQGTLTQLNCYLQNNTKRRIKYTETNNRVILFCPQTDEEDVVNFYIVLFCRYYFIIVIFFFLHGIVLFRPQTDEEDVVNFLLSTEIIPLCLRIMENGSELSKTVATFILQKILLDETMIGLQYVCQVSFRLV